jgi:hypothetical protein
MNDRCTLIMPNEVKNIPEKGVYIVKGYLKIFQLY